MALDRKDVRFKLDPSIHMLLVAVATDSDFAAFDELRGKQA